MYIYIYIYIYIYFKLEICFERGTTGFSIMPYTVFNIYIYIYIYIIYIYIYIYMILYMIPGVSRVRSGEITK